MYYFNKSLFIVDIFIFLGINYKKQRGRLVKINFMTTIYEARKTID